AHLHLVGRRTPARDVHELLAENGFDDKAVGGDPCIDVALGADLERFYAFKPRARGALDHVITQCKEPRRGDNAEQAAGLEIDAAGVRFNAEKAHGKNEFATRVFEQLEEGRLSVRHLEGTAPKRLGKHTIAVNRPQIEEDIDIEEVL